MKLCFSTLGCTELSLKEALSLANRFSIPAIEIRGLNSIMANSQIPELKPESTKATLKLFKEHKVTPIVLGTSCKFHTEDFCAKAIIEGKESINIAARLGIPFIRVFGNNLTEDKESCVARVTEGITAICEYAKKCKITVLLEVHGDFNNVEVLSPIVEKLSKNESFGLLWDIAHTHNEYKSNWQTFYECFKKIIRHVHIKDKCEADNTLTQIGTGDIPIAQIMSTMLNDGFDGYFSLEWERKWHPELPKVDEALQAFTILTNKLNQTPKR